MKKQLITLLMAGLLVVGFGGSALAATVDVTGSDILDQQGTVKAEMDLPVTWTVTIPADVAFTKGDVAVKELTFSATEMLVKEKNSVKVTLATAGTDIVDSNLTLKAKDAADGTPLSAALTVNDNPVVADTTVIAEFSGGLAGIAAKDSISTMKIAVPEIVNKYAGEYGATMNFDIKYGPIA